MEDKLGPQEVARVALERNENVAPTKIHCVKDGDVALV